MEGVEGEEDIEVLDEGVQQARSDAEESTFRKPVIVPFSKGKAGNILYQTQDQYTMYTAGFNGGDKNPYEPFKSKLDWEFAKWAKMRGPGSTAVSELLNIEGVSDTKLYIKDCTHQNLSYCSALISRIETPMS